MSFTLIDLGENLWVRAESINGLHPSDERNDTHTTIYVRGEAWTVKMTVPEVLQLIKTAMTQ